MGGRQSGSWNKNALLQIKNENWVDNGRQFHLYPHEIYSYAVCHSACGVSSTDAQQTVFHLNNVYCLVFSSTFGVVAWLVLSCIVVAENVCVCANMNTLNHWLRAHFRSPKISISATEGERMPYYMRRLVNFVFIVHETCNIGIMITSKARPHALHFPPLDGRQSHFDSNFTFSRRRCFLFCP